MSDGVNIVGRHAYEKYEKKVKELNPTVDSKSFYISFKDICKKRMMNGQNVNGNLNLTSFLYLYFFCFFNLWFVVKFACKFFP